MVYILGYNKSENYKLNWELKITKIEELLNGWLKRDLSLLGKIQIIKSCAIPQITLAATILPIPSNIISDINRLLFRFLWCSNDKVKRIHVVKPIQTGGLNMIDLECYVASLKANWVNRILNAKFDNDAWVQLPIYYFEQFDLSGNGLKFNFDKISEFKEIKSLPPFYVEVVTYFNRAFVTDKATFIKSIGNQYLWGNKYITVNNGKKKNVLMFRNWIRSGIRKISDLSFLNGKLNDAYIFTKVREKQNIFSEISILKKALSPYIDILKNISAIPNEEQHLNKSKDFYRTFLIAKIGDNTVSKFLETFRNTTSEDYLFKSKVFDERESKLKEYNFKLLHGILPCNVNLKKWRVKENDSCDVCNEIQTISHLLFECQYVKPIWAKVNNLFNIAISFPMLLGINVDSQYNNILTVVGFVIYKEWLLLSLDCKNRPILPQFGKFRLELEIRCNIYKRCKTMRKNDIVLLENLINVFY